MSLIDDEELDFEPEEIEHHVPPKPTKPHRIPPPIHNGNDVICITSSDEERQTCGESVAETTASRWTLPSTLDRVFDCPPAKYRFHMEKGSVMSQDSEDDDEDISSMDEMVPIPTRTIVNNLAVAFPPIEEERLPSESSSATAVVFNRNFPSCTRPWTREFVTTDTRITSSHEIFSHFPRDFDVNLERPFKIPRIAASPMPALSDTISLHLPSEQLIPMDVDKTETESVVAPEIEPHPSPTPIDFRTANVHNWLDDTNRANRVDITDVPPVFYKLCFSHFFKRSCKYVNGGCHHSHDLTAILGTRLMGVDKMQLREAYKWTKRVPTFRCETISYFVRAFAKNKMLRELCNVITDSFENDLLNEREITSLVVQQMRLAAKLPLPECIKYILITIAVGDHPSLCDILMEVISEYKEYDGDWDCVLLMAIGVEEEFNISPINRIIDNCTNCLPGGRNLLFYIGQLIEKKLINNQEIPVDLFSALNAAIRNYSPTNNNNRGEKAVEETAEGVETLSSETSSIVTHRDIVLRPNTELEGLGAVVFGNPSYHPVFKLDYSLHNLYPHQENVADLVQMHDSDVRLLNEVIRNCDGKEFLELVEKYKDACSVTSFVCMTIADLKASKTVIFTCYHKLLTSIKEHSPSFMSVPFQKAIFEVITMNLLFELDGRCLYKEAALLLQQFYDWDSLVSSKLLNEKKRSLMGRYLYLCKILVKTHEYGTCFQILQNPKLKILERPTMWPLPSERQDLTRREKILTKFLSEGYHYDIVPVNSLFKIALTQTQFFAFNVEPYLSPMFTHLINEKAIPSLKCLYIDFSLYYWKVSVELLRAFTITLVSELPDKDRFFLYEKCVERGIYKAYNGDELVIQLPSDYTNIEMELLFSYFFSRLKPPAARELTVQIMNAKHRYDESVPDVLKDCVRSLDVVKETSFNILRTNFAIVIKPTQPFEYFYKFSPDPRYAQVWERK